MRHHAFLVASLLILGATSGSHAAIITQWNFNTQTTSPSTGSGTLAGVGGVNASTFASGSTSSDPGSPNFGLQTTAYPAQGSNSGTAGVQFNVSTLGYNGLSIQFDLRQSNTASQYYQLQVSTNGTTFVNVDSSMGSGSLAPNQSSTNTASFSNAGLLSNTTTSNDFVRGITYTFSTSAYNNLAGFAFRVVSVFAPGSSAYTAAGGTSSTYNGSTGTVRFDMVTLNGSATGTVVPEPASVALVGLGLVGVVALRRRVSCC